MMRYLRQIMPLINQIEKYNKDKLKSDVVGALIVSILVIPQSLAYAMLAGLPPQYGLYASVIPVVVYALFGSSTTLAVGPVAIASIMTASALAKVTQTGIVDYVEGAVILALLSGVFLIVLGLCRFGFIANFLSHSVISGFITASALLIALSQLKHILGIANNDHTFFSIAKAILPMLDQIHWLTFFIGIGSVIFLFLVRIYGTQCFTSIGLSSSTAKILSRMAPLLGVVVTTLIVASFSLDQQGVIIVGDIPNGIGEFGLPSFNLAAIEALMLPAFFIAIIGYVESIALARKFAAPRKEKILPNQELVALGSASITAGLVGTYPVTGGLSRTVINADAGGKTQLTGIYTAIGITFITLYLTPFLYYLPNAMLAATIIIAVLSLVDFSIFKHAWQFSRSDLYAIVMTVVVTLFFGVEAGVASGIICSIILHFYHTSHPHVAEIGLLPGGEHFRNIKHFEVDTIPEIISLRIDESLLFSNVSYIEDYIDHLLQTRSKTKHIIFHCGAINSIDLSALEMLNALNLRLKKKSIQLHFSELKLPVKRQLDKTGFFDALNGSLFLSQYEAYTSIAKGMD